ncbi:MAG: ferredoxin [Gaiellaceae bacterium]|jgi:ferredoxin|nr:ferredoxin [Gaiellaceae bacterium]MDX6471327.1 ferredoxin [Gaiellaceae bacterium]
MQVVVDQDACIGAGNCVRTAPDVFDQGEEGLVELLDDTPPRELEEDVLLARRLCPARAITVT